MALSAALPSTVSALAAFALTHASIASSATESFVSLIIGGPSSAVQNLTASVPYTARPIGENVETSALLSRKARGASGTRLMKLFTSIGNFNLSPSSLPAHCQSYAARASHAVQPATGIAGVDVPFTP